MADRRHASSRWGWIVPSLVAMLLLYVPAALDLPASLAGTSIHVAGGARSNAPRDAVPSFSHGSSGVHREAGQAAQAAPAWTWQDETADRLPLSVRGGTASSMDVESTDLDGDGDADLVVAVEFGANRLLFNDGEGRFVDGSDGRLPRVVRDSEDIAIADLDGDGQPDLVFASEDDRLDELYLGDGSGAFADATARLGQGAGGAGAASPSNVVLALDFDQDFDRDYVLDLIFGNAGPNSFYRNDGTGHFERDDAVLAPAARTTQDIELGDIDGDGDLDLVEANEDGNRILVRGPEGSFTDETADRLPASSEETRQAELADVDGDGDLDLYLANVDFRQQGPPRPRDRLLLNDGLGVFTDVSAERLPSLALHTVDVKCMDLDADGDVDIALAHAFGGGIRLLENDGSAHFTDATRSYLPGPSAAFSSDLIDIEAFVLTSDTEGPVTKPVHALYLSAFRGGDVLLVRRPAAEPTIEPTVTTTAKRTPTAPIPYTPTTAPNATPTTTPTLASVTAEPIYLPRARR